MASNILDRAVSFGLERASHARSEYARLFKSHQSVLPPYLEGGPSLSSTLFDQMTEPEKRQVAMTISWVYADVKLIGN